VEFLGEMLLVGALNPNLPRP